MVTAETALAIPTIVLLLVFVLWAIGLQTQQMRCVDAARAAARELARGESPAAARAAAEQVIPNSSVVVSRTTDEVAVQVSATLPAPLNGPWKSVTVSGEAVAEVDSP